MTAYSPTEALDSDVFLRVARARAALAIVQARLGTALEQSEDMRRARELAHEVANLRTVLRWRVDGLVQ